MINNLTLDNIVEYINSPKDVKKLSLPELNQLADEIRKMLINRINETGGHMGPNLGVIELSIALHYVFNSPVDKIVFDVSHQSYTHKILTGRKENYSNRYKFNDISGFTDPIESIHDQFKVGHTSTSVSLATGLAKARDLCKRNENVIAIIGDGSLSGGEAFEGLNNASLLKSNLIIIINDNERSIAENVGGLYDNLAELRQTKGQSKNNFFKALGFDYLYLENGNCIEKLINTLKGVKDIKHPIVVHIHTLKSKGLKQAFLNQEKYHSMPAHLLDAIPNTNKYIENYYTDTTNFILEKSKNDKRIVVINPAAPGGIGFTQDFREKLGTHYVDVGIAEQHAVSYAAALAKGGAKPILAMQSSFAQRAYDQFSQDFAMNNLPATILLYRTGLTSLDATHVGCYDIPLFSNIPNLVYLAPTHKEEYLRMLDWSIEQDKYPVVIRVPMGTYHKTGVEDKTDYNILNKYKMVEKGSDVAILPVGNFFELGVKVRELLKEHDIYTTLINPRFISELDKNMLESLKKKHRLVVTIEDGSLDGGFGEKISRFYGNSDMKVLNFGAKKEFYSRIPLTKSYEDNRLTSKHIIEDIISVLNNI